MEGSPIPNNTESESSMISENVSNTATVTANQESSPAGQVISKNKLVKTPRQTIILVACLAGLLGITLGVLFGSIKRVKAKTNTTHTTITGVVSSR